ncbi:MAG: ribosome biogenesis GTPase Der [Spirochaetes bacterium]|nr:ribosome biogenesis GTPase Der [Spirochaetota bacterium]
MNNEEHKKRKSGTKSGTKPGLESRSKGTRGRKPAIVQTDSSTAEETVADVEIKDVRWENLPLVALVGRPNVGKSTLFNRLLHKRRSITDPTPGVTRDPIEEVCELPGSDKRVLLADSGGFKLEREGLDDLVVARTLSLISKADLILFIVDAVEITPEDAEFAELLRPLGRRLVLVVNKADSPEREPLVWSQMKWGIEPVVFVSAEHNRNIDELVSLIVSKLDFSAVRAVDLERADIRIAIMGKPNTGKSSLLNLLLGEERSIVSEIPGTTRDVVEGRFTWKGRGIIVLDTAGIRRKKKVTDDVEYYSVTRSIAVVTRADIVVLMIDAIEGLTEQDKKIAAFAVDEGRGVIFVLNKWDLMPTMKNAFEASRDKLRWFFGQMAYAPVIAMSAKEGSGLDKLMNSVVTMYSKLNRRVETSKLNRAVGSWIENMPPPAGPRARFKLRYAVQTSVNPQKFTFFVTRPDLVSDSYVSFLKNKIREEFDLDSIPVGLGLKASRVDWRDRQRS